MSSSSRASGKPDSRAMPSAADSTRPTCSADGPMTAFATFVFACSSQRSRLATTSVMRQLSADGFEIRLPVAGYDEIAAANLDACDQRRIASKGDAGFGADRLVKRLAHLLRLVIGERLGDDNFDRTARVGGGEAPLRFDRESAQFAAEAFAKRQERGARRQPLQQATGDVDGHFTRENVH